MNKSYIEDKIENLECLLGELNVKLNGDSIDKINTLFYVMDIVKNLENFLTEVEIKLDREFTKTVIPFDIDIKINELNESLENIQNKITNKLEMIFYFEDKIQKLENLLTETNQLTKEKLYSNKIKNHDDFNESLKVSDKLTNLEMLINHMETRLTMYNSYDETINRPKKKKRKYKKNTL